MTASQARFGAVTVVFGEKTGKYPDGNQVIVTGSDVRMVFDTPLSSHRAPETLAGADLAVLGHVHEDHTAAIGLLAGIPLFAPEQDVEAVRSVGGLMAHYGYAPATETRMKRVVAEDFHFQPRPDAQGYADGATWELGGCRVRAVHMPGHTRGHSVLMVEPDQVAFIGDIDLTGFGPYYGDATSNLKDFLVTLERMEKLEASVWITYHHKGVIRERETFLSLLRAFRDKITQREQAILAFLRGAPRTLGEMVAHRFLFPPGYEGVFVEDAERKTITEHLHLLGHQGRVVAEGGSYRLRAAG